MVLIGGWLKQYVLCFWLKAERGSVVRAGYEGGASQIGDHVEACCSRGRWKLNVCLLESNWPVSNAVNVHRELWKGLTQPSSSNCCNLPADAYRNSGKNWERLNFLFFFVLGSGAGNWQVLSEADWPHLAAQRILRQTLWSSEWLDVTSSGLFFLSSVRFHLVPGMVHNRFQILSPMIYMDGRGRWKKRHRNDKMTAVKDEIGKDPDFEIQCW